LSCDSFLDGVKAARLLDTLFGVPTEFVPADFTVPTEVTFDGFRLEPLGPQHNDRDHAAWTSSIDHIRATPGFPWGSWPVLMPPADNLRDLERHGEDFHLRQGFTYTVLDVASDVIGCVYIYPSGKEQLDAQVRSWVRADRSDLERPLYNAVRTWLQDVWPFQKVEYSARTTESR
jgi:hypothetical protein